MQCGKENSFTGGTSKGSTSIDDQSRSRGGGSGHSGGSGGGGGGHSGGNGGGGGCGEDEKGDSEQDDDEGKEEGGNDDDDDEDDDEDDVDDDDDGEKEAEDGSWEARKQAVVDEYNNKIQELAVVLAKTKDDAAKANARANGTAAVVSLNKIVAMDEASFLAWEAEQATETDAALLSMRKAELEMKKEELKRLNDAEKVNQLLMFDADHSTLKEEAQEAVKELERQILEESDKSSAEEQEEKEAEERAVEELSEAANQKFKQMRVLEGSMKKAAQKARGGIEKLERAAQAADSGAEEARKVARKLEKAVKELKSKGGEEAKGKAQGALDAAETSKHTC